MRCLIKTLLLSLLFILFGCEEKATDTPTLPRGRCKTPSYADAVAVVGGFAYIADHSDGLRVIDVSNVESPTLVGGADTPGATAIDVALRENYAFIVDVDSGLQILNIQDPHLPRLIGGCSVSGYAFGIAVSGDHAYVASADSGLQIFNVSDVSRPHFEGVYKDSGAVYYVAIDGNYAYLANSREGLEIVDVTQPRSPRLLGRAGSHGGDWPKIALAPPYAYVTHGHYFEGSSGTLEVINIDDPERPFLVGSCDSLLRINDIVVASSYAYCAVGSSVQAIDITNAHVPVLASTYHTTPSITAVGVCIEGNHIFVAEGWDGLQVITVPLRADQD